MTDARDAGEGWPEWVREWVLPYVDDSVLWPVAFSLLGHVVIVIVPLMLQVYRTGSGTAVFVLTLLAGGTGYLIKMELEAIRRPGVLTAVLSFMWLCSLPFAWFAESTGVL